MPRGKKGRNTSLLRPERTREPGSEATDPPSAKRPAPRLAVLFDGKGSLPESRRSRIAAVTYVSEWEILNLSSKQPDQRALLGTLIRHSALP